MNHPRGPPAPGFDHFPFTSQLNRSRFDFGSSSDVRQTQNQIIHPKIRSTLVDANCSQRQKSKLNFGKRKSNSSSSYGSRSVKQHITEARITASMQRLNIDFQRPSSDQHDGVDDDGFFDGAGTDDSDEVLDTDNMFKEEETDEGMSEDMTRYRLDPEVKKMMEKKNDNILPKAIFDSIAPKPCMALVPYVPPIHLQLLGNSKATSSQTIPSKPIETVKASSTIEDMCIEEWDSCDDSYMLE